MTRDALFDERSTGLRSVPIFWSVWCMENPPKPYDFLSPANSTARIWVLTIHPDRQKVPLSKRGVLKCGVLDVSKSAFALTSCRTHGLSDAPLFWKHRIIVPFPVFPVDGVVALMTLSYTRSAPAKPESGEWLAYSSHPQWAYDG